MWMNFLSLSDTHTNARAFSIKSLCEERKIERITSVVIMHYIRKILRWRTMFHVTEIARWLKKKKKTYKKNNLMSSRKYFIGVRGTRGTETLEVTANTSMAASNLKPFHTPTLGVPPVIAPLHRDAGAEIRARTCCWWRHLHVSSVSLISTCSAGGEYLGVASIWCYKA